jgi:hypothetical protein
MYAAGKAQVLQIRRCCRQLNSTPQMCGNWNSMEGNRDHGTVWKHYVTAKVFSVGTRTVSGRESIQTIISRCVWMAFLDRL